MKQLQLLFICLPLLGYGQAEPGELVLTSEDSLSIFQLIDSLISITPEKEPDQLAFRVGYNSNINAGGYAFKLNEFGLSTRATYYHHSGVFLDATGYLSNQYTPNYYLTMVSLGYMSYGLKKWSFMAEYNRYFYNTPKEEIPVSVIYTYNDNYSSQAFKNCFAAALFYQDKSFNFKFDYSLLTGDRTGHRFMPSLFYNFTKRKWHKIDKISIYPTVSVLWGIEEVPYYQRLFSTYREAVFRIRHNLPLFEEKSKKEFGVMNYALRLPITVSHKNWSYTVAYTFNFPERLPGETATIKNGGSLALSIVRYVELKRK